jgi:phosphatidylserine/phosphatidylglycerophosphate/cardiolipin synthase-like enzyme
MNGSPWLFYRVGTPRRRRPASPVGQVADLAVSAVGQDVGRTPCPPAHRAGLQRTTLPPVGQVADLAARIPPPRRPAPLLALLILLLHALLCPATASDLIRLRDGRELDGRILQNTSAGYVLVPSNSPSQILRIPREATAFVLYADQTQAARLLGLDSAARHLAKAPAPADVRLLAAEPFGKALLDAVRSASNSIWISAYYFSDSRASPIKDFYAALREKASAGVEVVILAENSTASPPAMRRANANFADALAQAGIQASLWSGTNRSLHKKLVVVDGRILLLGSSNLSLSGTYGSIEMNVATEAPHLVQAAIADFQRLRTQLRQRQATP